MKSLRTRPDEIDFTDFFSFSAALDAFSFGSHPGAGATQAEPPAASSTAAFPDGVSSGDVTQTSAAALDAFSFGSHPGAGATQAEPPAGSSTAAFPDGVSSGDVTQTSAVLWARAVETGELIFQISTDPSFHHVKSQHLTVADPLVPVKVEFDHLKAGQHYFYRLVDASGDTLQGSFTTASELGAHNGFQFALVADLHGELAPFVSIKNAAAADLDLVVKLGDTVYADIPPPAATTLDEFRLAHDEVYGSHLGFNYWADLQANTPILAMIDDHEVINNFAGGASPSSDPRFAGQPGDFINETPLYLNGVQAFNEYNAIENRTYSGTGEDRFDGAPDLYRYNTYGSDAAIILTDERSFRDAELPGPTNPLDPTQISQFLTASFDPSRSILGDVQFARVEHDLLDARDNGVTWKFVMLPEPIQNFGPVLSPGDRFEGYAAERNALLKFIDDNHIENVVFVSADQHWTSVNNLTYQETSGGPQIKSGAFEVDAMAAAAGSFAPLLPAAALQLGLITPQQLAFYNSLANAPDTDSIPNDKDDFVKAILNGYMTKLGYDPIGLESGGPIHATLLQGDYFVGHDYGWTDFNIDPGTGQLFVTTWGIPSYTAVDLAANPDRILAQDPTIVSQFEVTPTSNSIIGTDKSDLLIGTEGADVIIAAGGNDEVDGKGSNDYLDGGKGNDVVYGGDGDDRIFGRDGNDTLYGQNGNDRIDGGAGNDVLFGGSGNDTFVFSESPGSDVIADFVAAGADHDVIEFSKSAFADWTALQDAISDGPQGAIITVGEHDTITVFGVTSAELMANHANVFHFV